MILTRETVVARSLEDVFAYACDEHRLVEWREGLQRSTRIGPPGPLDGARFREVLQTPAGLQTSVVVVSVEPLASVTFRVVEGFVRPVGTMRFERDGERTRITYRVEVATGFGVIGTMIERTMVRITDRSQQRLRERLEARD